MIRVWGGFPTSDFLEQKISTVATVELLATLYIEYYQAQFGILALYFAMQYNILFSYKLSEKRKIISIK